MIIELRGGPLHGTIHELPMGLPARLLPDVFALPSDDGHTLHWYQTAADGCAEFVKSEPAGNFDDDKNRVD